MRIEGVSAGRDFWLRWMLACTVALIVGIVVLLVIEVTGIADSLPPVVFGVVAGTIFGSAFGIAQARVLRRHLEGGRWVVTSIVGFAAGLGISMGLLGGISGVASSVVDTFVTALTHGALLGAVLGTVQWFALRRKVEQSEWWVLISVIGWAVGVAVGEVAQLFLGGPFDLVVGFILAGAITGLGMVRLMQHRVELARA